MPSATNSRIYSVLLLVLVLGAMCSYPRRISVNRWKKVSKLEKSVRQYPYNFDVQTVYQVEGDEPGFAVKPVLALSYLASLLLAYFLPSVFFNTCNASCTSALTRTSTITFASTSIFTTTSSTFLSSKLTATKVFTLTSVTTSAYSTTYTSTSVLIASSISTTVSTLSVTWTSTSTALNLITTTSKSTQPLTSTTTAAITSTSTTVVSSTSSVISTITANTTPKVTVTSTSATTVLATTTTQCPFLGTVPNCSPVGRSLGDILESIVIQESDGVAESFGKDGDGGIVDSEDDIYFDQERQHSTLELNASSYLIATSMLNITTTLPSTSFTPMFVSVDRNSRNEFPLPWLQSSMEQSD